MSRCDRSAFCLFQSGGKYSFCLGFRDFRTRSGPFPGPTSGPSARARSRGQGVRALGIGVSRSSGRLPKIRAWRSLSGTSFPERQRAGKGRSVVVYESMERAMGNCRIKIGLSPGTVRRAGKKWEWIESADPGALKGLPIPWFPKSRDVRWNGVEMADLPA